MPTIRLTNDEIVDLRAVVQVEVDEVEEEINGLRFMINANAEVNAQRRELEKELLIMNRVLAKLMAAPLNAMAAPLNAMAAPVNANANANNQNVGPVVGQNNAAANNSENVNAGPNAPANADPLRNNVGGHRRKSRKSRKGKINSRKMRK